MASKSAAIHSALNQNVGRCSTKTMTEQFCFPVLRFSCQIKLSPSQGLTAGRFLGATWPVRYSKDSRCKRSENCRMHSKESTANDGLRKRCRYGRTWERSTQRAESLALHFLCTAITLSVLELKPILNLQNSGFSKILIGDN